MNISGAKVLLGIFLISVSLIPLVELGHGILHTFRNPLHYHQIHERRNEIPHTIADHHFPKMKFAHEMAETPSTPNFIAILYMFFQQVPTMTAWANAAIHDHNTQWTDIWYLVHLCPPSPPPPAS